MRFCQLVISCVFLNIAQGQSLLPNGSFEETTPFWETHFKTIIDSCGGGYFIDKTKYIKYAREMRPSNETTKLAWNYPVLSCGCKDTTTGIYQATPFGRSTFGFGRGSSWNYFSLKIYCPLKKYIPYSLSYFVTGGDVYYNSDGIRSPSGFGDELGFSLATYPPVAPDRQHTYKAAKAWQMPGLAVLGWNRMVNTFVPDSAYTHLAFGIYDSNYVVHLERAFPVEKMSAAVKTISSYMFLDSVNLRPWGAKTPKIVASKSSVCEGTVVGFTNSTLENVVWEVNGVAIIIDSIFFYQFDSSSLVIGYNSHGTDTFYIEVNQKPKPPVISQSEIWCHNNVTLTATGGIYDRLYWIRSGGSDTFINVYDTIVQYIELKLGLCIDTVLVRIEHMCAPILPDDTLLCAGVNYLVKNLNEEEAIWTVNGFAKGSSESVYLANITETTTVKAENLKGADEMLIKVKQDCTDNFSFYVPSAFTPNGTAPNDFFGPVVSGIAAWHLQVYNTWGQKVYDSGPSSTNYWNGADCSAGIYIWRLQMSHEFLGVTHITNKTGKLLLLR